MSAGSKKSDGLDEGTCAVMETTMLEEGFFAPSTGSGGGVNDVGNKKQLESLCRVCANTSDYFIPIFEGEGLEHQLDMKIQKHLPIQVLEVDNLPAHVCYQCASTLIAWHDLVTACVEADKKLHRLLQEEADEEFGGDHDEKVVEFFNEPPVDSDGADDFSEPSTSAVVAELKESLPPQKRKPAGKGKRKVHESASSERDAKVNTVPADSKDACTGQKEGVESASSTERCGLSVLAFTNASLQISKPQHKVSCSRHAQNAEVMHNFKSTSEPHAGKHLAGNKDLLEYKRLYKCLMSLNDDELIVQRNNSADDVDPLLLEEFHNVSFYECAYCTKKFKSRMTLENHVRIHTGERPFTCHICGKGFRAKIGLSRHMKDVHEGIKNSECDICGQKFANNRTKNDHRRTHTDERPFVCAVCGKTFRTSASLYVHNKFHQDVFPFECSYCGKKFRLRSHLNPHVRIHTGEKPHGCDLCSKRFNQKTELNNHRLVHSELRSFVCAVCGKDFKQRRSLKNHEIACHKDL